MEKANIGKQFAPPVTGFSQMTSHLSLSNQLAFHTELFYKICSCIHVLCISTVQVMRTPVKEGHPSPIHSPQSASPLHRARPHTDRQSPGKSKPAKPKSPAHRAASPPSKPRAEDDYEEDFDEETPGNVSSMEEDNGQGT